MKIVRPCLVITALLLVLCTALYPVVVTGVAHAVFPREAEGSLIVDHGRVRGSSLLGQTFVRPEEHPEYFWGRPSAASVDGATGLVYSSGSNQGPSNATLHDEVRARVAALRATGVVGPIPVDLVTRSASGLDPHISPAAARVQVARVARARNLRETEVQAMVNAHTEGSTFGLLGEPRVNVLELNLALDARAVR